MNNTIDPSGFATCPCGSTTFLVLQHRLMCSECGAGTDIPELDMLKLVNDANADGAEDALVQTGQTGANQHQRGVVSRTQPGLPNAPRQFRS